MTAGLLRLGLYAGSAASGVAASEFIQDGASTFSPSHCTGEDDSSDWDRFSDDGAETTSSTALSDGSNPASQVAVQACRQDVTYK